VTSARRFSETR